MKKVSKVDSGLDMCGNPAFDSVFHISFDEGCSDEGMICGIHAKNVMENTKGWKKVASPRGFTTASSSCVSHEAIYITVHLFGQSFRVKFQIMEDAYFPIMIGQQIKDNLGIDSINSKKTWKLIIIFRNLREY